jgi:hypothetical protein
MNLNQEELGSLTNQQINILVADKLGIMWYITPVNNEDDPWVWEFSDILHGDRKSLMHYCDGEGITDIMVAYEIGAVPTQEGVWKVGSNHYGLTPWRGICEEFLLIQVENYATNW